MKQLQEQQSQQQFQQENIGYSDYQFHSQQYYLKEIKSKIRTLFTFYASFGDRININTIKSNNFHKLMLDAEIRDNKILTQNKLDILFIKENKHKLNMSFDVFLSLLMKIAVIKFSYCQNPSDAFSMLLDQNLLPLYENIMRETDLGEDKKKFNEKIQAETLLLNRNVKNILRQIYDAYFPWETKTKQNDKEIIQQSEKALFLFLKEYDICPALVTKSTAYLLFNDLLEIELQEIIQRHNQQNLEEFLGEKNIGQKFTFQKFQVYLMKISAICYETLYQQIQEDSQYAQYNDANNSKNNQQNLSSLQEKSQSQKYAFLLEIMELSQGFLNLQKKSHKPNNSQTNYIINQKSKNRQNQSIQEKENIGDISNYFGEDESIQSKVNLSMQNKNQIQNQNQKQSQSVAQSKYVQELKQQKIQSQIKNQDNRLFMQNQSNISYLQQQQRQNQSQNYSLLQQYSIQDLQLQNQHCFKNKHELIRIQPQSLMIFDQFADQLLELFQRYCSFGDPLNNTKMKSNKFAKLLKDIGVVNKLNRTNYKQQEENGNESIINQLFIEDIDIIFAKITARKLQKGQKNNLEFENFLQALEQIAFKMFQDQNIVDSLNFIIQQVIMGKNKSEKDIQTKGQCDQNQSIQNQETYVQKLMGLLQDQEIVELLGIVHKSLVYYYKNYCDKNQHMDFNGLTKFAKDFGIFPEIVAKSKLFKIFSTLASIYKSTDVNKLENNKSVIKNKNKLKQNQNNQDIIDQHLFVEALVLCALEIPYEEEQEPSNVEKICYLMERMNQSDGTKIVQQQNGQNRNSSYNMDLLHQLRKEYPSIFYNNIGKQNQCQFNMHYQNNGYNNITNRNQSINQSNFNVSIMNNQSQQQEFNIDQTLIEHYLNKSQQKNSSTHQQRQQQNQIKFNQNQQDSSFKNKQQQDIQELKQFQNFEQLQKQNMELFNQFYDNSIQDYDNLQRQIQEQDEEQEEDQTDFSHQQQSQQLYQLQQQQQYDQNQYKQQVQQWQEMFDFGSQNDESVQQNFKNQGYQQYQFDEDKQQKILGQDQNQKQQFKYYEENQNYNNNNNDNDILNNQNQQFEKPSPNFKQIN